MAHRRARPMEVKRKVAKGMLALSGPRSGVFLAGEDEDEETVCDAARPVAVRSVVGRQGRAGYASVAADGRCGGGMGREEEET